MAHIQTSQERLPAEAIITGLPLPVVLLDEETLGVRYANPAATRALGYGLNELMGLELQNLLPPGDAKRVAALLETQGNVHGYLGSRSHWTLVASDGSVLLLQNAGRTVTYEGRPCMLLCAPTAEPGAGPSQGERTEFSYGVFHDLKEPLQVIAGYLALLEEAASDRLKPEEQEFLQYAAQATHRIHGLITNLLDYLKAGSNPLKLEPVSLEQSFIEANENLRLLISNTQAQVEHDPLPNVRADRVLIGRVLQNLLSNAVKFHVAPPRVHVTAERRNDAWMISVQDDGIGIDSQKVDEVFQPFHRLQSQERYEGTGLGLSTCRRIIERHGGRIWIEPAPQQGTVVRFTLPDEIPGVA